MTTDPDERRPLLTCEGLVIGHRGRGLLPPFDLEVRRGEILLVVGRNGAGKSTLVRTLLGLLAPVRGQVRAARPDLRLAYVPQDAGLDEIVPVRAREVAGWGHLRGWRFLRPWLRRGERDEVARVMTEVQAEAFADQRFRELSGGQRQRVLFARALAGGAELVLLDEPTASMDMTSELDAYQRIAALAARGLGVVVVTHTVGLASRYARRAVFLDRRDRARGQVVSGPLAEVFAHDQFRHEFPGVSLAAGA
jgi:zinc transport system ATP-binding protein